MQFEFLKHRRAYVMLVIGLVMLSLVFFASWPDRLWQRLTVVAMAAFYFAWGVLVHRQNEHFSRRIVLEYGSFALLAGVILLLVTI